MDRCEGNRDVQALTRRPLLCFHTDRPDAVQQRGKLIGDVHQFPVKLVVFNPFEDLVETVQPPVETIVGPAPQSFPKFRIVLAPLPGGAEKAQ